MKLYRNAIILTLVLGLIAGAYFVVKAKHKPAQTQQESTSVYDSMLKIIDVKVDDIDTVTLNNKGTKIVVAKNGEDWGMTYPENLRSDKYKSRAVAMNVAPLYAGKKLADSIDNPAKYGLDKPVEVIVKMKDGSEKAAYFGNKTATGENYYVKVKDDNALYTVSTAISEKLVLGVYDLKDKNLFAGTYDNVKKFTLWRNGKTVFSVAKQTGDEEDARTSVASQVNGDSSAWTLTAPVEGNADATKVKPVVDSVLGVMISTLTESNAADLGKYGLDNPAYSMEVDSTVGTTKVYLGKELDTGTEIYAKTADSNDVYTIKTSSLGFIDKPLKDIVDVFAYIVNIDDVDKITVTMNGNTDNYDIQHTTDGNKANDKFFMNGKDASMKDSEGNQIFREYYKNLIGIKMEDINLDAVPSGQPEITVIYQLGKTNETVKLEMIPKDEFYYYVVKDGKYSGILTAKKTFAKDGDLMKSYDDLKAAVK